MDESDFNARFLRNYEPGEVIFHEGDPGSKMFVIKAGVVDIVKAGPAGEKSVFTIAEGEIFGEMALIDDLPRSATAQAGAEGAVIMEIDHGLFVYLVGQQPAFALIILKALSFRLRAKSLSPSRHANLPGPGPRGHGKGNGEVIRLKENVYQLKGKCSSYLVKGHKKNILIDTGVPSDTEQLTGQLASVGMRPEDVHLLILTHEHLDHIGCVPLFSKSALVGAHTMAANKVAMQDEFVLMSESFHLNRDDYHIDLHLHHGTVIDLGGTAFQVLHTPGHCSGAICLFEPDQQMLFTGDTIFADGVLGGIFPSGSISDYILTLRQLSKLKVKELYPGHGRMSASPERDFEKAINAATGLASDTRDLFGVLDSHEEFTKVYKAISTYSRRG